MSNVKMINIVSQAFYGNRVGTKINVEDVDRFILGDLSNDVINEPIDRTIIRIPNTDNIVIVYNKYKEEERKNFKEEVFKAENHVIKPIAIIPENNIEIYSRCIVCRMDENGNLDSLQNGDYEEFVKYLAE